MLMEVGHAFLYLSTSLCIQLRFFGRCQLVSELDFAQKMFSSWADFLSTNSTIDQLESRWVRYRPKKICFAEQLWAKQAENGKMGEKVSGASCEPGRRKLLFSKKCQKPPAPAPSLLNYFFRGKRWKNFYLYRKEAQNEIIIGTKVNSGQFYSHKPTLICSTKQLEVAFFNCLVL